MAAILDSISKFVGGNPDEPGDRRDTSDIFEATGDGTVDSADSSLLEAQERIAKVRRKRGRPSLREKSGLLGGGSESSESTTEKKEAARLARELEKLFDPKYWRAVVRAPADARLAITGREHWKLSSDEVDSLADTASVAARQLVSIDPRFLATTLLLFNVATVYGSRLVLDSKLAREGKK